MITNFHSKYWGLQVLKDDNYDYYYEFECFGNYKTIFSFCMESYYYHDNPISLEEFFKNSYYTFLWIRTNISTLYNCLL